MKISTCTVSYEGYSNISGNDSRLILLEESIKKLKKENVDLATFPGGFLFANNLEYVIKLSKQIRILAIKYNIHIALGIDTKQKSIKEKDAFIINYSLPWFAMIIYPDNKAPALWRQRSFNSKNQKYTSKEICNEIRTLNINLKTIEILMCGEIFNPKIRSSIIKRGINIAIDLGHTSKGFRVVSAMKVLAKNGVKTFCSVHTQAQNAMKYSYIPEKSNEFKKISTRNTDILIDSKPRLEFAIWNI
ncbi:MAG: hypothetical protein KAI43_12765 [Candidatus Aureabacteria bacterium]|nr:hypothetical protein [Candidatus Auribacterota bacterium]